jgi:hypothetical protein
MLFRSEAQVITHHVDSRIAMASLVCIYQTRKQVTQQKMETPTILQPRILANQPRLRCDDSPCRKRARSSLVEFSPMTERLLGLHKIVRVESKTVVGPRIQPSRIVDVQQKEMDDVSDNDSLTSTFQTRIVLSHGPMIPEQLACCPVRMQQMQ